MSQNQFNHVTKEIDKWPIQQQKQKLLPLCVCGWDWVLQHIILRFSFQPEVMRHARFWKVYFIQVGQKTYNRSYFGGTQILYFADFQAADIIYSKN